MLEVSPHGRARGFTALSAGWAVSLTGDGVRMVALPLTAALLTGDPLAVTAVAAAELLPWLLLSLPAGALVDRWDPRTVVVTGHLVRVALSLALAAGLLAGVVGVPALCAAAFALTVADTFADAAQQVALVRLVPRRRLTWANARFRTIETLTLTTVGPLLGGVLVAASPAAAFALDGASFLVAGVLALALPRRRAPVHDQPVPRPDRALLAALGAEVREGLQVVVRTPALRVLAATTLAASLAVGAVNALLALFALQTLGLPVAAVPVLVVLQALGVLVGARTVTGLVDRAGEGRVLVAALVVTGTAFGVVGLAPHAVVAAPAYLVSGLGFGWWNVAVAARRQRTTPDGLQARVANANRTVGWGAMPLGAGAGGLVATALGQPAVYLVAGALLVGAALVARRGLLRDPAADGVGAAARAG